MSLRNRFSATSRLILLLVVAWFSLSLTGVVQAALYNYKLNGSLVTGGDVARFEMSPDGQYAVFLADARTNTVTELFSVPVSGGPRIQLSGTLPSGSAVQDFLVSPDSQTVVYWTATLDGFCTGLYATPITGGSPVNIAGSVPAFKKLYKALFTADSLFVVFNLEHIEPEVAISEVLWVAPLAGRGGYAITSDPCNVCSYNFEVTPTGSQVVYVLTHRFGSQLNRSDMDGTREVLADYYVRDLAITPDGDWIVYSNIIDDPFVELFSIPIEGGDPIKLSGALVDGGRVQDFQVAPDSQLVVYRADEVVDEKMELFSAPVDGSAARVRLLGAMIPNGDVLDYQITPNSLGVVYRADQLVDERLDLGAVGINGGTAYWLNKEMVAGGDVTAYSITPNNLGVIFIADKLVDETFELFAVSIVGTQLTQLNPGLLADRDVLDFQISPNSQGVIYRADQAANDVVNLYAVPSVGGVPPTQVNGLLTTGGDVQVYAITPDSLGVLYLADQESDGVDELFATFDRQLIYLPLTRR